MPELWRGDRLDENIEGKESPDDLAFCLVPGGREVEEKEK